MRHSFSPLLSLILVFVSSAFLSCQNPSGNNLSDSPQVPEPKNSNFFLSERFNEFLPNRVALLPFKELKRAGQKDNADEEHLSIPPETIRKIFYGHFAPLGYYDIELSETDRVLKKNGITAENLEKTSPSKLGKLLNADTLIYGYIIGCDMTYALLYSQMCLGLSMRMISAETGEVLWEFQKIKRSHNFRLGLDPLSIVSGAAQAAMVFRKKIWSDWLRTFQGIWSRRSPPREKMSILSCIRHGWNLITIYTNRKVIPLRSAFGEKPVTRQYLESNPLLPRLR